MRTDILELSAILDHDHLEGQLRWKPLCQVRTLKHLHQCSAFIYLVPSILMILAYYTLHLLLFDQMLSS